MVGQLCCRIRHSYTRLAAVVVTRPCHWVNSRPLELAHGLRVPRSVRIMNVDVVAATVVEANGVVVVVVVVAVFDKQLKRMGW
jgi:hypothetical protein